MNNDGLSDILVGEYQGHVKYYMAVTADSLTEMDDLKAAGEYINGGLVSAPCVFDWNNDSVLDLVVAYASSDSGSVIKLFMNSGTPGNPVFEAGIDVLCGNENVKVSGGTPFFGDLDQDGLTDLIFGEVTGKVYYCRNTGTVSAPVFDTPQALQTSGGDISLLLNSSPVISDWNEDGFPDIVAGRGETGYVLVFLSPFTGGISQPETPDNNLRLQLLNNPCAACIQFNATLPFPAQLKVDLFNLTGRLIRRFTSEYLSAGTTSLQMDIGNIPCGIYLLSVSSGSLSGTCRIAVTGGTE